jgi:hypothetical protein
MKGRGIKTRSRAGLSSPSPPPKQNKNGTKTKTNRKQLPEAEPRRSVRSTKGQHTKSFDELEQTAPKRRQTKKTKKAQEQEQEEQDQDQDAEEVIRCVCGATEQDDDSGEAWISCETCDAWQHNICVGVSGFEEDIPEYYWCEQCKPEDHKELLEAMARGEKLWEERRRIAEEQKKQKRKGGRKPKAKRQSNAKEDKDTADKEKEKEAEKEKEKEKEKEAAKAKAKTPPAPEPAKDKKETPAKGKRKTREESNDAEGKVRLLPSPLTITFLQALTFS